MNIDIHAYKYIHIIKYIYINIYTDYKQIVFKMEEIFKSNSGVIYYEEKVISGKEKTIEQNILREAMDNNINDEIGEVFVPYEKVVQLRNNKKVYSYRFSGHFNWWWRSKYYYYRNYKKIHT